MAEQGGIDQRVKLRQRFGAQFLGVELQSLGDAWKLGRVPCAGGRIPIARCIPGVTWSASAICAWNRESSSRRRRSRMCSGTSVVVAVEFWFISFSPFFVDLISADEAI